VVAVAMVGAAFAAVPLYKAFCQATGFDGTVRRATRAPTHQIDQTVTVGFDTNVRGVPWDFQPEKRSIDLKLGATGIAYFKVTNTSDQPVTARAVYNVTPEQAGPYLRKLQCFCFSAQTLAPHQTAQFPVVFFIDPGFATDIDTRNFTDVVLSYTFFPAKPDAETKTVKSSAPRPPAPLGEARAARL
jgi:cytochrome c oxidase assembly protein subunit 11